MHTHTHTMEYKCLKLIVLSIQSSLNSNNEIFLPVDVSTVNGSVTLCTAVYNETVKLNCSLSDGIWFKSGYPHSVCQSSVCILTDLSFTASSGSYFCKATDLKFYLNLTVQGKKMTSFHC